MVKPIMSAADVEWRGWKRELEHRHKLREDEKEYLRWKQATQPQSLQQRSACKLEKAIARFY